MRQQAEINRISGGQIEQTWGNNLTSDRKRVSLWTDASLENLIKGPHSTFLGIYSSLEARGIQPRVSKLSCGESRFAIKENTDKAKKILEARYENWFYLWFLFWRRKWQPTPVLLPGKFHGLRCLVGYSPWGRKVSETNWATSLHLLHTLSLEKEMATHSSILAWRIPWTGEPGRSMVHGVTESRTWLKWLSMHAWFSFKFSSVQFSRSVVSDSLRPHESQHSSPPCPSPTPVVYSNSCLSSRCCQFKISLTYFKFFIFIFVLKE